MTLFLAAARVQRSNGRQYEDLLQKECNGGNITLIRCNKGLIVQCRISRDIVESMQIFSFNFVLCYKDSRAILWTLSSWNNINKFVFPVNIPQVTYLSSVRFYDCAVVTQDRRYLFNWFIAGTPFFVSGKINNCAIRTLPILTY